MADRPLLTQDELDFIHAVEESSPRPEPALQLDANGALKALLSRCAADEQLTIDAHFAKQRLTFTANLSEDAQHLQLGTPQIFEEGPSSRAWRVPLTPAVELLQRNGRRSGLWVHELSMDGMLVEARGRSKAPAQMRLILPLPGQKPIAIEGTRVRAATQGLRAYRLATLDTPSGERLLQFIYRRHRALFPEAHRA